MRSRVSDLTESLLRQPFDIEWLSRAGDEPEEFLDYLDGPDYFDDECIYDSVDDQTALWLLNDWLDERANVGWQANLELSKLLAKRGRLVAAKVEPIVRQLIASECSPARGCASASCHG